MSRTMTMKDLTLLGVTDVKKHALLNTFTSESM